MEFEEESAQLLNYLTEDNGARVVASTSNTDNTARNVINSNKNQLWVSQPGLPQSITLSIANVGNRPASFQSFGWNCWHAYNSNPRQAVLYVSEDGHAFTKWASVYGENRPGNQMFVIDPIGSDVTHLKFEVVETFGASKTYVNQIFLSGDAKGNRRPFDSAASTPLRQMESPSPFLDRRSPTPATLPNIDRAVVHQDASELKQKLSQQLSDMTDEIAGIQFDADAMAPLQPPLSAFRTPSRSLNFGTPQQPPRSAAPAFQEAPSYLSETPMRDAIIQESAEIDTIRRQVHTLESSVREVQGAVEMLTKKIAQLREGKQRKIADTLQTFKEGILLDLNRSVGGMSEQSSSTKDHWDRNMAQWQERVLEPQLQNMSESLEHKLYQLQRHQPEPDSTRHNVTDIMAELHRKLAEKANKLEQLEIEHSRRKDGSRRQDSPTYSESSTEFIRFKPPRSRF